jgi:hypothetical protein
MIHGLLLHSLSSQNGNIENVHINHRHVEKEIPHPMPPLVATSLRRVRCA